MLKKVIILVFFIVVCFFVFSFNGNDKWEDKENRFIEDRGIFISYIELSKYVKNNDSLKSMSNVDKMINNIYNMGFNMTILQVRSFSDAIYKSDLYPWSSSVSSSEGINPGYDVLKYFIEKAHEKGIKVYAWINPYRVRTTEDINSITDINPAFKYINTDTLYVGDGIFYNPSKKEVEEMVVEGVEEVVKNYDVDGVLFDDYFYPNSDIDIDDYEEYISKNEFMEIDDYHLMIINNMVKKVHEVCEEYDVLFGISPDGNINNNYTKVFADVKTWMSSAQYIDFIMPQIYYGFYNETQAFKKVIDEWSSLVLSDEVDLYIALAFYKVGSLDKWARSGSDEWINNDNIIMREIMLSRNLEKYKGFSLFRYDYLFNEDFYTTTTLKEIENMKKVLN